jgi:hypothetical protein
LLCARARAQVERLYETFKIISSSGANDGLIDRPKFELALGLRSSLFVDRIFQVRSSARRARGRDGRGCAAGGPPLWGRAVRACERRCA